MKRSKLGLLAFIFFFFNLGVEAFAADITILNKLQIHSIGTAERITEIVKEVLDTSRLQEVRVHIFPDYLILQLRKKEFHRVDFVRVNLNQEHQVLSVQAAYKYSNDELKAQDQRAPFTCPDPEIQFIAFAPNNQSTEQSVTLDVIQEAEKNGLKVQALLKENATRINYLSYMSCPNLVGNFYDGDSNPESFITVDGVIGAIEISGLKGLFHYKVTNIWVACEAFNDPMFGAVTKDAQAQKYAAGVNDLLIGPSDLAAACAMKAAIDGSAMNQAFEDCYKKYDNPNDKWGFAGSGSDTFGH